MMAKVSKEYKTISQIAGPLVFVKKTEPIGYQEMVSVRLSDGSMKRGQGLERSRLPEEIFRNPLHRTHCVSCVCSGHSTPS
jgi:Archaeal/vacuolar-type H+-ATPase subunit B